MIPPARSQVSQAAWSKGQKDLLTLIRILLPALTHDLGKNKSWNLCKAGIRGDVEGTYPGSRVLRIVNTLSLFLVRPPV